MSEGSGSDTNDSIKSKEKWGKSIDMEMPVIRYEFQYIYTKIIKRFEKSETDIRELKSEIISIKKTLLFLALMILSIMIYLCVKLFIS